MGVPNTLNTLTDSSIDSTSSLPGNVIHDFNLDTSGAKELLSQPGPTSPIVAALGAAAGASLGGGEVPPADPSSGGANFAGEPIGAGGGSAGPATGSGGGFSMPAASAESPEALASQGLTETSPGVWESSAGANLSGAAPSFIDATTPTIKVSPETSQLLGINNTFSGDLPLATDTATGMVPGGAPTFESGVGDPGLNSFPGEPEGQFGGPTGMSTGTTSPGYLDQMQALLKKLGLSPASAGMLGISGAQALTKPKIPQASRTLEGQSTAGGRQASAVIQSGGQSSPAWDGQKKSIDANIDAQFEEQSAAIKQNAINSGQGADSQLTLQKLQDLKSGLETQRQSLYLQAQGQNVQNALKQLGISDQALSGVAAAQYKASQDARSSAANTAQMALMLQALSSRKA